MAENQTETPVQEQPYSIRVEDSGPATKKVFIEVPKEKVAEKIAEQYKELRQGALIPGFRKGHVPQKLLEKKFRDDVKEQVRRTLISDSYQKAIDDNKLQVIGEPEFENPDAIKLEDDSALNYAFSVEVQPDINLPELKGIKVKKPKIQVNDEHVDQAMLNLREQQGTLVPVEDRGVLAKDHVICDIQIKVDGAVLSGQTDSQIVVRPGRVAGLQIDDFDKQLEGAKAGEMRDVVVKVPEDSPAQNLRGKEVHIEISIKDIKRLEAADITPEFLDGLGFHNEKELRDALREQMEERIRFDIQQVMRRQVIDYLQNNVQVELPVKLSEKQADRIVSRRAVDLMMRGMPRERVQANLDQLKQGAVEEGARELKSFFILGKVAQLEEVDVSEPELNGRIALIAMQQGRRPEKLKQELARDSNTLASLYVQMREEKAVDKVLESAQIEEVEPTAEQQQAVSEIKADESASSAT
jgi:trigger factor